MHQFDATVRDERFLVNFGAASQYLRSSVWLGRIFTHPPEKVIVGNPLTTYSWLIVLGLFFSFITEIGISWMHEQEREPKPA
jgi:hypothetical protein